MSGTLNRIFIISFILVVVASGCKKAIEINPPINELSSATIFASDKTAQGALTGMYANLSQVAAQTTGLPVNTSLMADDLKYLSNVVLQQEYNNNAYTPLSSTSDMFSGWYAVIYRANAIIEGLQKYSGTSDKIRKQLSAEAKYVRAYCYFNLVNLYGGVPLVLQTDVNVTAYQPRESVENIYQQILIDLLAAKSDLLADFSFTSNERIGVNKFTAAALLARVYLFTGNYAAAESNASEVIASSLFSIIPSATMGTGVFVKNSAESIWQIMPALQSSNQYTTEASEFLPASNTAAMMKYDLQPNLLQIFQSTDLRRTRWISDITIGTTIYRVPFKYKYRTNALALAANISEYPVILRLPEQYLIRAESRARLGSNLTGALGDLNVTRVRAGLAASTTTGAASLLDEIALENRREFFCEQAFRWFNLKRTGQADAVMSALKPSYTSKSKLLPIAQSIIDTNPNLIQNPGY
ncbi:RagB/SusD family nutrient uptake outer membrane protein [Mucilaginibacter sp. PAMB04274]|uniref:RagB/SusD family nutrient uptake outer membrane protein n=1 Tax=Mucilaginibacter sp. PAMB04274 TaxID=3138568 RepID=UPI0031F601B6